MGEAFPVPMTARGEIRLILVDGSDEIAMRVRTRGFEWCRNMAKLRDIMGPNRLHEWSFHSVPLFAVRAGDVTRDLLAAAARQVTIYDKP